MLKRLFGIILGTVAGVAIVFAVESIAAALYPMADFESADRETLARLMAAMPLGAKLLVAAAWFLGALGGAWLALRVSDWRWAGWIIAAFIMAGGVANLVAIPHPLWMQAGALLLPLLGGWIAARVHHKPYPGEPLLG